VWLAASWSWLSADRLLRDGDEEGHVGAAELFVEMARRGDLIAYLDAAWRGSLGEYPPLFPALVGGWWWLLGGGQPGRPAVRAFCLLSLLIAAWATGRVAARALPRMRYAETVAFGAVLLLPLGNGLVRHFMPEGALIGAVALAVLAARSAAERPGSHGRAAVLGSALGLGMLIKQTFLLGAALPVLFIARGLGLRLLTTAAVALALCGPWYIGQLTAQLDYGRASLSGGAAGPLAHAAYYPAVLLWIGLGPVLGLAALAGLGGLRERARREGALIGAIWLLGGMLLLTLIPKKYPRLAAPLLPGAALLIAGLGRRSAGVTLALGAGVLTWTSLRVQPTPALVADVDPRCLQRWLRPPVDDDLGMSAVSALVSAAPPGPVRVIGEPEIPCDLQTTHAWSNHLSPWLRRDGHEREVISDPTRRATVVVDWTESGTSGTGIAVPALGRSVRVEGEE